MDSVKASFQPAPGRRPTYLAPQSIGNLAGISPLYRYTPDGRLQIIFEE